MDEIRNTKTVEEVQAEEGIAVVPADWAYPKIYQMKIELHDGTSIDGHAQKAPYSNEIYVYPDGTNHNYIELVTMFGDPEKTQMIHAHVSENETITYTGYTQLGSIVVNNRGEYTVTLRRP